MRFKDFFCCFLISLVQFALAQQGKEFRMHSHNDYHQNVPFWKAVSCGLSSVEVDIFLKNDTLFVTHAASEIIKGRTIENLYLQPIQKMINLNLGDQKALQLLVDIKSNAYTSLNKLISILKKYPEIINNQQISIVISGNRPKVSEYKNYPDYIYFDYQSLKSISDSSIWKKIALISLNYRRFSSWRGSGSLPAKDFEKLSSIVDQAHDYGKPFRFWGAPDKPGAWKVFMDLGIDFINTDDPIGLSTYMRSKKQ